MSTAGIERTRDLLLAVGLDPHEDEVRAIAQALPLARAIADSLYVVPDVRYAEPAVEFTPRAGSGPCEH